MHDLYMWRDAYKISISVYGMKLKLGDMTLSIKRDNGRHQVCSSDSLKGILKGNFNFVLCQNYQKKEVGIDFSL